VARSFAAAFALALVLSASASATESTIYPGVGIGEVKLGMTVAQAKKALGPGAIVNAREGAYTEYAWNFASWTVGAERGRVVQVSTTVHAQKTSKKVGPGTFWLKLVHAYPGGVCTFPAEGSWGGGPEYLVPHKGGTQTIFFMRAWPTNVGRYGGPSSPTTYFVGSVQVRTPYKALPEFAPNYQFRCKAGWQSTPLPEPNR